MASWLKYWLEHPSRSYPGCPAARSMSRADEARLESNIEHCHDFHPKLRMPTARHQVINNTCKADISETQVMVGDIARSLPSPSLQFPHALGLGCTMPTEAFKLIGGRDQESHQPLGFHVADCGPGCCCGSIPHQGGLTPVLGPSSAVPEKADKTSNAPASLSAAILWMPWTWPAYYVAYCCNACRPQNKKKKQKKENSNTNLHVLMHSGRGRCNGIVLNSTV